MPHKKGRTKVKTHGDKHRKRINAGRNPGSRNAVAVAPRASIPGSNYVTDSAANSTFSAQGPAPTKTLEPPESPVSSEPTSPMDDGSPGLEGAKTHLIGSADTERDKLLEGAKATHLEGAKAMATHLIRSADTERGKLEGKFVSPCSFVSCC